MFSFRFVGGVQIRGGGPNPLADLEREGGSKSAGTPERWNGGMVENDPKS